MLNSGTFFYIKFTFRKSTICFQARKKISYESQGQPTVSANGPTTRSHLYCEEPETACKQVSTAALKHFIHKSRFRVDLASTLYSANFCPTMVLFLRFDCTESLVLIWVPR